ncbi:hypothetical protein CHARACLAT_022971, partial [Characodon lateralis]|nr:hypothetical protein [Characodon lateralis]
SLKSDEETGSTRINQPLFQNKADEEDGGGRGVLPAVCDHLALQDVDELLRRLDADLGGRVTVREFSKALWSSAPTLSSTPVRSADLQRALHRNQPLVKEEGPARSASPSLLLASVGQRVLSRLDDGSGCTSPERVVALWTEEGIRNSQEILQTLDFPLEERLSLADLTLVLDNELLVSGNGIHQAALISYKTEIQHLQEAAEQACRERDKLRTDLDLAQQRNLQLVREVDDRHASMETLNESKIRDLEQDFRERLASLRCQSEQESEALLQQVERERSALQEELQLLRAQEAELQEELSSTAQEKQHLEDELYAVKMKLSEAESSVERLQRDLDQLLHHKFGSLDPSGATLNHEERFSELLREYELQRRELQDRNDELSSELELLKSHRSSRKSHLPAGGDVSELSWSQQHSGTDDSEMKSSSSSAGRKRLLPGDKMALSSLDLSGPPVSIHTELALQQLKENHEQELQQLQIQLETQGNYYERQLDMMKQNIEVERKDISQAFKLEISELEEQKAQVELQVKQLKETVDRLQTQVQQGGGGRSSEVERRIQWERAELEQNYAREISNLVQRLSGEKDQLEAEMKLKMDQEVMRVREETQQEGKRRMKEEVKSLKEQVCSLQEAALRSSQTQAGLEEDLEASRRRSSELQTRLEEARSQLEESITYLESQEVRNKRLASEKGSMEGELQQVRKKEAELLDQMDQLKAELTDHSYSSALQTVTFLRSELDKLQAALGSRTESISRLTTELDSLKMDRDRLIQDLKEQAMAVDTLQLQLDAVSEELDQRKRSEAALQEALQEEQNRASELQSSLTEEKEEVTYLSQENSTYMRLVDQLSTQIVEMEEEISSLREHLRGLSLQLNDTADLVLDLRRQLNSRTSQVERLQSEAGDRTSEQVLFLQRALQDSQNQLTSTQEDFDREKRRLAQRLMELENLVLDLEDVTEVAGPHRTQLEEVRSENAALQERLKVLQQEVQNLEDEAERKRRRLQEMEREHERSREEEERLHREVRHTLKV